MTHHARGNVFLDQILSLSQQAFEDRHFQAAYNLLVTGMHYARDIKSEDYLAELAGLALEQSVSINTYAPDSPLSCHSARKRNGIDVYPTLIRQLYRSMVSLHGKESLHASVVE